MELEHKTGMQISESRKFLAPQLVDALFSEPDLPSVGMIERTQDMQQGTLPGAGRSRDGDDLSLFYAEVDPF